MKYMLSCCFLLVIHTAWAQTIPPDISGQVLGQQPEPHGVVALPNARVSWVGTTAGTLTDPKGYFRLARQATDTALVISYIGYRPDTIQVGDQRELTITLSSDLTLDQVDIEHRQQTTFSSSLDPVRTELIGEGELLKAACCNLSESFETIPSVDVAFTDAVTGTRQIQLLGLAGPYTQISRESMPFARGLNAAYGLTFIPGTWVESIQLSKGTGSVVNGYESIAGQINVELRKPETADRLYLNAYVNRMGRTELNANFAHQLPGNRWSTALLLHGGLNSVENDRNADGFLDNPLGGRFIGLNRWKYIGPNNWRFQAAVKGTFVDTRAGQVAFEPTEHALGADVWGMQLRTRRIEGWAKLGKVFPEQPNRSLGFQVAGAYHQQDSYFGQISYDAIQQSLYANAIYQGILGQPNHRFRTGASLQYDEVGESLVGESFERREIVPGAYFEYTYSYLTRLSLVAGLRADYHNLFGAFLTPRLHLRYQPLDRTTLRLSAGRGQRTANIFAENNRFFASSRVIRVEGEDPALPYGLQPEVAWNLGANATQTFRLDYRDGSITVDAYRTEFINQVVIDLDRSAQEVAFYNLDGRSFSNSIQAQVDYELVKFLDLRVAYRWFDVWTTYDGVLRQQPLVSAHRAFVNVAYQTRSKWIFDMTVNWQGSKRLPSTEGNPEQFQLPERSPDFVLVNAQVTKKWGEAFELYVGGENLLNFRQEVPILSAEQPFGENFDASLVWGPIFGRNLYLGIRYRIPS